MDMEIFGSLDGDPPAAYRYTEARLAPAALDLLSELNKETVDFQPNYDGKGEEPLVLPSRFPNLLVNGSTGHCGGHGHQYPPAQPSEKSSTQLRRLINESEMFHFGFDQIRQRPRLSHRWRNPQ